LALVKNIKNSIKKKNSRAPLRLTSSRLSTDLVHCTNLSTDALNISKNKRPIRSNPPKRELALASTK
jgi:hypothetical protein